MAICGVLVLLAVLSVASTYAADVALENISVSKLAFGSCNRHDLPQPLWNSIGKRKPDIFLWLGDVVYADSRIAPFVWRSSPLSVVSQRFDEQKKKPEYKVLYLNGKNETAFKDTYVDSTVELWSNQFGNTPDGLLLGIVYIYMRFLESSIPIFGVWDDHDYNMNDGGRENMNREEVQQIFLDFLDEEEDSWRRQRDGLYASYLFGKDERKVKLILLDVRSHLDRETGDVLGHQQWVWLEREILNDDGAALIVVGSGMQVITEMTVIDKISNFPQSHQRLLQILAQNPKVLILSGDVHFGEISCHNISTHPVYEVTSSGLTHNCFVSLVPEFVCYLAINYFLKQEKRISSYAYSDLNYGMVSVDWSTSQVTLAVYGEEKVALSYTYSMSTSKLEKCPPPTQQPVGVSVLTWILGLLLLVVLCRATICRYSTVDTRW